MKWGLKMPFYEDLSAKVSLQWSRIELLLMMYVGVATDNFSAPKRNPKHLISPAALIPDKSLVMKEAI